MVSESEALLRAAARVAADDTSAENERSQQAQETVVIHVTIKGVGSWTLNTLGEVRDTSSSSEGTARARLHLTYASEDVFLGLAYKRLDPRAAMFTGKLSFRGEMGLGIRLGWWIRKAVEVQAAAAGSEGGGVARLEITEREKWERDEDAEVCRICRQDFKVYRRRHHCRYCGRVVCDDCSGSKIAGKRACDHCRASADAARESAQEMSLTPAGRGGPVASGGAGGEAATPDDVRDLQSQVLELEEQVDTLDRRAFASRANLLRQAVLCVYRMIAVSLFALLLIVAHCGGKALMWQVGPDLYKVEVNVTPLSDAISSSRAQLGAVVRAAARAKFVSSAHAALTNASGASEDNEAGRSGGGRGGSTPCSGNACGVARNAGRDQEGSAVSSRGDIDDGGWPQSCAGRDDSEGFICGSSMGQARAEGEERDEDSPEQYCPTTPRTLTLSLSTYWTVLVVVLAFVWEHLRRTEGLVLRRVKTFCLAGTAIFALKMTKKRTTGMGSTEADETWEDTHKLLAPYMYQSILEIAGIWVKAGQYLSSRADVMPQPYIDELSKLQDAVPASPFEEVEATVMQQLGRSSSELFASIEREALASASVAQVHRCTLKDGRQAVIKVQHRRVRQLFLEDLANISRLVRVVAWAEKDYDFRPLMTEWASESTKELDFYCEAKNLTRINNAMKRSGLEVIVPELVPEFTSIKVVVMTFCKGFKVTDAKALANAQVDREKLMRAVTESFAYQIHIDGMFNGDPHPGNILLQPTGDGGGGGDATEVLPVLLDWGLAKTLPESQRIAFSRFVHSACEHDFVSMLQAFEEMGIKLNRFDPAEDMHNIRFILRDTQPASEAREDMSKLHRRIARKKARGLKSPVDAYPGDLLFFLRVTMLLKGLAARLNVRQRYMHIMAPYAKQALREAVPKAERATQAIYPSPLLSPLEEKVRKIVQDLVEGGQVTGCQVAVIYRGQTLVDLCAGTQGPVDPRPVTPSTLFCAMSVGKAVCATAIHILAERGLLGYDQRVGEMWPEFASNGKGDTTVRHVLTHSTGLHHAFPDMATFDSVCDWEAMRTMLEEAKPAWRPGSRASYHYYTFGWLVAGIVEKASGKSFGEFIREDIAIPLKVESSFFLGDLAKHGVEDTRIASIEHTFEPPGSSNSSTPDSGTGGDKDAEALNAQTSPDAISSSPSSSSRSKRRGAGGRRKADLVGPASSVEVAGVDEIVGIEDVETTVTGDGDGGPGDKEEGLGLLGMMASALKETDPDESAAMKGLARKLVGREYFLDPRVFNHRQMREACIPAANGRFTAKALAIMYDNFLQSLGLSDGRARSEGWDGALSACAPLLKRSTVNDMRVFQVKESGALHVLLGLPARGVRYALGYQMFGFREKPRSQAHSAAMSAVSSTVSSTSVAAAGSGVGGGDTSRSQSTIMKRILPGTTAGDRGRQGEAAATSSVSAPRKGRVRLSGFGHVGTGGSVALCDPTSGLAFAMVTNKLATGRESSSAVLSLVCEELGIGDPSHFFED